MMDSGIKVFGADDHVSPGGKVGRCDHVGSRGLATIGDRLRSKVGRRSSGHRHRFPLSWLSLAALLSLGDIGHLYAQPPGLPQGGSVIAGSATIAASNKQMTITTGTDRSVISWDSFSIGKGNQVTIQQPSVNSVNVDRVTGGDPSRIYGSLQSNGRVVLTNPNGVWFGPDAKVNVAGVVATSHRLSDANAQAFAKGDTLKLDPGSATASVVNEGTITASQGGFAALVAPGVSNSGTINARLGKVQLASGTTTTVDFYGDGLINLAVSGQTSSRPLDADGKPLDAAVANSGKISAEGGKVTLSANVAKGIIDNVVNMNGVIEAKGVSTKGGVVELLGNDGSISVGGSVDVSGQKGQKGGRVRLQAGDAKASERGVANLTGSIDASSVDDAGGMVDVSSRYAYVGGTVTTSGKSGGSVKVKAKAVLQTAAVRADATKGPGGSVEVSGSEGIIQTSGANTTATSVDGAGGSVSLTTGANGRIFSSGYLGATGTTGGDITLLGSSIALAAATLDASGATRGGNIVVGGGLHGQGDLRASDTLINPATVLNADATGSGNGGTIVVWSDTTTTFQGSARARGGLNGGNGGLIEISSAQQLNMFGTGDASAIKGDAGTLLLDPKNIIIDSTAGGVAQFDLIDPTEGNGTTLFGNVTVQLSDGTIVVTKPGATIGGAANAGAVYFYNPTTGALTASFTGSTAGDQVGSGGSSYGGGKNGDGITFLNYTNWYNFWYGPNAYTSDLVRDGTKAYLIASPFWNNGAGAVTWVAANSTISGVLSSANSFVGAAAGDSIGLGASGLTANTGNINIWLLPNNNFVIPSPIFGSGKGAVTFGTAAGKFADNSSFLGTVSSSNSLIGSTGNYAANNLAGDQVGSGGLVMLKNNNFVVLSPTWNKSAGAVTFGNQASGFTNGIGTLSATNSLIGATAGTIYQNTVSTNYAVFDGDGVGSSTSYITTLSSGDYVVASPAWNHGKGAVTFGSGTTGKVGTVGSAISLVGTTGGSGDTGGGLYYTNNNGNRNYYGSDLLGSSGIAELGNGAFVIKSPSWNSNRGAVTYVASGTTDLHTLTVSGSSLVGSTAATGAGTYNSNHDSNFGGGDQVGGVTVLPNSNYVVTSSVWNSSKGSVTVVSGSNGHTLLGSNNSAGDTVSATNSLVGGSAGDAVGTTITTLFNTDATNSNKFVASSSGWGSGKGEVTLIDGATGLVGTVSSTNSLVGTTAYVTGSLGGDNVGNSITALTNGNWVITSPNWANYKGAVTFVASGTTPTGNISSTNSLVGATAASYGTAPYTNGICTTCSNGSPAYYGGDQVGSGGIFKLTNNNFLVFSPNWSSKKGAVTFANGSSGAMLDGTTSLKGTISASNSLVGSNASTDFTSSQTDSNGTAVTYTGWRYTVGGDQVGSSVIGTPVVSLSNGNFVLSSSHWTKDTGALTFGRSDGTFDGTNPFIGTISSTNSLVGSTASVQTSPADLTKANRALDDTGDRIGNEGIVSLTGGNGNYLIGSGYWQGSKGAVTWGSGTSGVTGVLSSSNSLVGSTSGTYSGTGDSVGYGLPWYIYYLPTNNNYVIQSPYWNSAFGASTYGTPSSLTPGVISSSNSLVGSHANDYAGISATYLPSITSLGAGDYTITSSNWNSNAGAVTWSNGTGAVTGVISTSNSITGATTQSPANTYAQSLIDSKQFLLSLAGDGSGRVVLAHTDPTIWTYSRAQGNTVKIGPSLLTTALNSGTNLVLQANNDITVNSSIVTNAASTASLSLSAGRSVVIGAGVSINTGNGNLTVLANDSVANGVVDANRDAGNAAITMDSTATLSAGTGTITLTLASSTDKTNNAAGDISLGTINASSVTVKNLGSAGGALTLGGKITATATGTSILLATGGVYTNDYGSSAVLAPGAGRYLLYSGDPRNNKLNGSGGAAGAADGTNHLFGQTFTANPPASQAASGNYYLYSATPTLTVTSSGSVGYGDTLGSLTPQITGYIDGDTVTTAVSGSASYSSAYVAGDAVGSNKAVTVSQGTLTSPLGYIFSFSNGTVSVTAKTLTVALTGTASKTYDATNTATLSASNYQLTGLYNTDTISISKTAATYGQTDAGTGLAVSVTGGLVNGDFSAGAGTTLANYVLPTGALSGTIGTISAKTLTASLTGGPISKGYDGTNTATLTAANYSLSGLIGAQSMTVNQTSGTYAQSGIGTNLSVTSATLASGNFTAGAGTTLANYVLPTSATGNIGTITTKTLTASLTGTVSKTYDGANTATLAANNYQLTGLASGESITVSQTSGTYGQTGVGTNISVSSASLVNGDFTAGAGTSLANYVLPSGVISGNVGTITAKTLTATLTGTVSKTYDGSNTATLASNNYSLSGLVGAQSMTVGQTSGTYAQSNAGTNLTVTSATLAGGDFTAGAGTSLTNYVLPTTASGAIGTINAKTLTASLTGGPISKGYDATNSATLAASNYQLNGLVGAQSITVSQTSGTYAQSAVGTNISITSATLASSDFTAGAGTTLGNYVLPTSASGTIGTITTKTLTASLTGTVSKTYDGTNTATLASNNYQLTGLANGESITVSQASGTFAQSDAGTGISISSASLGNSNFTAGAGTSLANYVLPSGVISGNIGSITAKTLTASLTGGPVSKTYDGSTSATLTSSNYQLSGLVGTQSITVAQPAATYAQSDVGSNLTTSATLSSSNFTAGAGTVLSNYVLPTSASGAIGSVTAKTLTASLTGTVSKTYDGANTATLATSNYQLSGLVGSQSITVTQPAATYAQSDVGSNLATSATLSSSNFSAGAGTVLSNYVLPTSASGAIGSITAKTLTASLTGTASKTYDGANTATLTSSNYQLNGLVGTQSISVAQTAGTYAQSDVGSNLTTSATLTSSNFTGGAGTVLSNYVLPTSASGAIGSITAKTLTASLIGGPVSKIYDGTNTATLTSSNYQLSGLVGNQSITVAQSLGTYAQSDVGSNLATSATLSSSNFSAGAGTVLSNYVLPTSASGAIGSITAKTLTASLTGTVSKTYDGANTATLASSNYQLSGLVGNQSITVAQSLGTYAQSDVGSNLTTSATLTSSNFTAGSGTVLSNYVLPTSASGAIGSITAKTLTASLIGGPVSKIYDGTNTATLTSSNYQLSGLVGSQSITVAQPLGIYAQSDVGSNLTTSVTLTSSNFTGGAGTVLSNYVLPTSASGAIGSITAKTLTASLTGTVSKTYDGANTATLASNNYQLSGLVGNQSITVAQSLGTYAQGDVGSNLTTSATLSSSNFTAGTGTVLSNYVLPTSASGAIGSITAKTLTASLIGGPVSKTYDGTNTATLTSSNYQLSGLVGNQSITVAQPAASYAQSDVGSNLTTSATLTSSNFSAGTGTVLSNYVLPTSASGAIGSITAKTLTASL
ncbi:MAG: filamentous hemagglutinin N-terminal domain-containing protein, partial [Magnetococcales bacterium]|nr:filamentous hemagglutinin N-terminal domain-containing protein [Magnetococcales bacterium]